MEEERVKSEVTASEPASELGEATSSEAVVE